MTRDVPVDRGPLFDGVRIGRPATGALMTRGIARCSLPANLATLSALHGVGPSAIRRLAEARDDRR
ncbi:helix-hairpin-helix domain-containing protein [Rhodococcus sp. NBC_00294]|uniref:helix-hairpin-helix domain-containing protein n=1 Tax=Rhodococcus sp. NBC_00294 TaxID=2976004 RepID=UPI002E27E7D2|nr:helix-hairpin-helix domain-containing protein [Rhodococcus sp. NBC_00294]